MDSLVECGVENERGREEGGEQCIVAAAAAASLAVKIFVDISVERLDSS